jgi:hypothetical protein
MLTFTPRESLLAAIQLGIAPIQFVATFGRVLFDHGSI